MIATAFLFGWTADFLPGLLAQAGPMAPAAGSAGDVADPAAMLTWALLLFAAALALFFAEIFLPTGGLLGVVSGGCLVGGIVCLFRVDTTLGLAGAVATVLTIPFLVMLALKIWPDTPIGRLLILREEMPKTQGNPGAASAGAVRPVAGATGRALTDLRPVGTCQIAGHRYECLADGPMIGKGRSVRVTAVDGLQIKVRRAAEPTA